MTHGGPAAEPAPDGGLGEVTWALDGPGLDCLELMEGGALGGPCRLALADAASADPLEAPDGPGTARLIEAALAAGAPVTLVDPENTPVALFVPDAAETAGPAATATGRLTPLRDLARGVGPDWDPAVRRPAREVRALTSARPTLALVFEGLPTSDDVAAARRELAAGPEDVVLWVAWVASDEPGTLDRPDAGSIARAVLAEVPDGAIGLVVPGARLGEGRLRPAGTTEAAAVLAGFGATRVVRFPSRGAGVIDRALPDVSAAQATRLRELQARRGVYVMFTGLSGSGKSTLARALADRLAHAYPRAVTVLDGDRTRRLLSSGLGFDPASREVNVRRIGYVAIETARAGGIVISALIAPATATRAAVRRAAGRAGIGFVEVHVATPLAVAEARDRKGLYAKARRGEISDFTGVSAPYEPPEHPEVVVDTSAEPLADAVTRLADAVALALPRT